MEKSFCREGVWYNGGGGERDKMFYDRKSPRLKHFDYATPTMYFVTICTHEKRCIFGQPSQLNEYGKIARSDIDQLNEHYPFVHIYHAVVMPNHVHLLLGISSDHKTAATLSSIISAYKAGVSRKIHLSDPAITVWQRSFHDHIPRNNESLEKIWHYIDDNPIKWEMDTFYCNETL